MVLCLPHVSNTALCLALCDMVAACTAKGHAAHSGALLLSLPASLAISYHSLHDPNSFSRTVSFLEKRHILDPDFSEHHDSRNRTKNEPKSKCG